VNAAGGEDAQKVEGGADGWMQVFTWPGIPQDGTLAGEVHCWPAGHTPTGFGVQLLASWVTCSSMLSSQL
jgi:membrane-associated PAP2 superfamily phosphatase